MDRPIIVLTQVTGAALAIAYLGTDAAEAEKIYAAKSTDVSLDAVAIYFYPTPRITAAPSSHAAVAKHSLAAQRNPEREKTFADHKAAALARITAERKAEIEAQATAEAEAAIKAVQVSKVVVAAVSAAIAEVAVNAAGESPATERIDAMAAAPAEPAATPTLLTPDSSPSDSSVPSESDEPASHFAAPPRRKK